MKRLRLKYSLPQLCRVLKLSASGYYAWVDRRLSKWAKEEARLMIEIQGAHRRTRYVYSAEKLQHDLASHGIQAGLCRIKRIRKKLGIRCKQKKKFKATTNSNHRLPVVENILNRQFRTDAPNKVWVSDITYIPTDEGWLYLAGHKDLFSGDIVGYSMGERMTKHLVRESLLKAIRTRHPDKGLLHHSDRGSQYCAHDFRNLLKQHGMIASMSRKGNCYDNAPMESFWGTLKQELTNHRRYQTRREAMQDIIEYIEIFYRRQRLQSVRGFLSPVVFEQRYYAGLLAA